MKYSKEKYEKIYDLIKQNIPYRKIAEIMEVDKNTVSAVFKRKKETGKIYPSNIPLDLYHPDTKSVINLISILMNIKRKTFRKNYTTNLSKKEIQTIVSPIVPTLSEAKFKKLYRIALNKKSETYFTIHYNPAETIQFDWGYMMINIAGKNKRVYFAAFYMPYSQYQVCLVTERETNRHFSEVFLRFVERVNGFSDEILIDNMKIAKKVHDPTVKDKNLTLFFKEISEHYNFSVRFCANNCPNQKGNVEIGVKVAKNIIKDDYESEYQSLEEIQKVVDKGLEEKNSEMHSTKNNTRKELFKEEQALMNPLPTKPYVFYHYVTRRVGRKDLFVQLNTSKYLVPEGHQGEKVVVRYNDEKIYIISEFGNIIAKYNNSHKRNKKYHRIWYIPNRIKTKHKGFEYTKEFRTMPKWLKKIYIYIYDRNPVEFAALIEKAKNKPKDFLKKALRRNNTNINNLTKEQLEKELYR
jgi:hypothetical protein